MKNLIKFIGKSLLGGVFFCIGVLLVYAATTISGLGQKTIESGDKIGTGWFNEVEESVVPQGAVMAFDINNCPEGWTEIDRAQGRFIIGKGSLSGYVYSLGSTGGEAKHILTIDEMPSHRHEQQYRGYSSNNRGTRDISSASNGLTSDYTSMTGGDQPHENRPPYLALLYCKKN